MIFRKRVPTSEPPCRQGPLFFVVLVAVAVGALAWANMCVVETLNAESARLHAATNLRILAVLTQASHPGLTLTIEYDRGGIARASEMPIFVDHVVVDRTIRAAGSVATIFVADANGAFIRRITNVKRENGDRAGGTALAADHPARAPLKASRAYYGPTTLFGRQFIIAYQPVIQVLREQTPAFRPR